MTLTTLRLSDRGGIVTLRDHGAGDPVILIHGVGMQSAAWGPQIAELSRTHRVIAIDLPGHGGSAALAPALGVSGYVTWLHEVVAALDLGPVSVVGHSMGALIASGFAVEHPALTKRVCVLGSVYRRDAAARAAVVARATEIAQGKLDVETPLDRWFGNVAADRAARAQVAGWLGTVDPQGYAAAYAAFAKGDATYAERLRQIDCPFLAITGDGDPNSTPAMAQGMADQVPGGRAITIRGHRHMVNLTAPEQINAHLMVWLKTPAILRETQ